VRQKIRSGDLHVVIGEVASRFVGVVARRVQVPQQMLCREVSGVSSGCVTGAPEETRGVAARRVEE